MPDLIADLELRRAARRRKKFQHRLDRRGGRSSSANAVRCARRRMDDAAARIDEHHVERDAAVYPHPQMRLLSRSTNAHAFRPGRSRTNIRSLRDCCPACRLAVTRNTGVVEGRGMDRQGRARVSTARSSGPSRWVRRGRDRQQSDARQRECQPQAGIRLRRRARTFSARRRACLHRSPGRKVETGQEQARTPAKVGRRRDAEAGATIAPAALRPAERTDAPWRSSSVVHLSAPGSRTVAARPRRSSASDWLVARARSYPPARRRCRTRSAALWPRRASCWRASRAGCDRRLRNAVAPATGFAVPGEVEVERRAVRAQVAIAGTGEAGQKAVARASGG